MIKKILRLWDYPQVKFFVWFILIAFNADQLTVIIFSLLIGVLTLLGIKQVLEKILIILLDDSDQQK